jgi:hypothetical protein
MITAIMIKAQVKLDKETSESAIPTAALDPKDKLAALREKRRMREAGIASTPSTSRDLASTPSTTKDVASTPGTTRDIISTTRDVASTVVTTATSATTSSSSITSLDNTVSIAAAHTAITTDSAEEMPQKVARKSISIDLDEASTDTIPEVGNSTVENIDINKYDSTVEETNAVSANCTQIDSKSQSSSNGKVDTPLSAAELLGSYDNNDMARLQQLLFTAQCEIKEKQSLLTESDYQLINALKNADNEKKEKEIYSIELSTLKLSFDSLRKQFITSKETEMNLTKLSLKAKEGKD